MAWEIDSTHSTVEFAVIHLMINTVKGRFPELSGTLHLDSKYPEHSWIKAQVKTASIQTNVPQRDAHLRSADFFDASKYLTISFASTHVQLVNQHSSYVIGDLSLHGVTRSIMFQVRYTGRSQDPLTNAWRVGFAARTSIDRRDFGMTFSQTGAGVLLVGYKVWIEINIEAVMV